MKKIKVGVVGVGRGKSMIQYCDIAKDVELVAICDKWKEGLDIQKSAHSHLNITYYEKFDDFINHDMDAVILANYATEHAPFAIKALKAGKHVFSEVLPTQTLKEAIELIETVEETGLIYAYGENYCYMSAPYEMKRLYEKGEIGEIEYAEGEYFHNCESIWSKITRGDPNHWRNNMYSTFYCTHSFGPIRHITGLRPVSVVGFEGGSDERAKRMGLKGRDFGIEMVTLENGAIVKSGHLGTYRDSVWYSISGTKGRMETAREDAENGAYDRIYINADEYSGAYGKNKIKSYMTNDKYQGEIAKFGHGGSDFYAMKHFIEKVAGKEDADIIDVYEALDMSLIGIFAYRSILQGGITVQIPNLRIKEERDKWRNDTACVDPLVAGDMLLPCRKGGNPDIDPTVYEYHRKTWQSMDDTDKR